MTLEQIKNDFKCLCICYKYGLQRDKAMLYKDVIIIPAIKKGTYFFFNDKLEVIEIHSQRDEASISTLHDLAVKYKDKYEYKDDSNPNYPYPCEFISMKDIYELGRDITVNGNEFGYSKLEYKGTQIKDDHSDIINTLYYIKFLYEAIKDYVEYSFKAAMNYYSHPTITNYLYRLMESINTFIAEQAEKGETVNPRDVLAYLGITNGDLNTYFEALYIIELVAKKNGFKFVDGEVVITPEETPADIDELINSIQEEPTSISRFDIDLYLADKMNQNALFDTEKTDFDLEDVQQADTSKPDISTYVRDIPQELFDEGDFGPEDLEDYEEAKKTTKEFYNGRFYKSYPAL